MPQIEFTQSDFDQSAWRIRSSLKVREPIDEVFTFFSDARNLEQITPPWMSFRVVTPQPIQMHAGQLINYRLKVHYVPLKWQSEITVWEPPHRFVDEQRHGPYRLWHHEHTFEESGGGTLVHDQVDYAVPGGWLIDRLFIRRDLKQIFKFRRDKLSQILTPV